VDGHAVLVGRRALLEEWAQHPSAALVSSAEALQGQGRTVVWVGWDGAARGILAVADAVKATSAEAVQNLKSLGLRPVLLTGDNETVARRIAAEVGIDEVIA